MTKLASHVSDPPVTESEQLHLAFEARTKPMTLTRDQRRRVIIRQHRAMLAAELRAERILTEDDGTNGEP